MKTGQSFSLQEANRMLPELRGKVENIVRIHMELKKIAAENEEALEAVRTTGNAPVHPVYFRLLEKLQALLGEVTSLGCEVKDLQTGLIDFPSTRGGRTVYLCWRLGEDQVGHWHEVNAGFAGRQPVDLDLP